MKNLLFIRHGRTQWNDEGRLQGHRDIDLNEDGRAQLTQCRLPASWRHAHWYSSPLLRTQHSARLLGAINLHTDARLMEMSWGQWEGCKLGDLRDKHTLAMQQNEARGLDFRPPGGESPRDVCARLQHWLMALLSEEPAAERSIVVTHKGVIRAALSLADDWDMLAKFRPRIDWDCAHEFVLSKSGQLRISQLNLSLSAGNEGSLQ